MFGIGGTELIILIIIVALLVGPEQVPGIVKGVQKFVKEVAKAREDFKQTVDQDETLSSIKKTVEEVKQEVQVRVNEVTSGVQKEIKELEKSINEESTIADGKEKENDKPRT